MWIGIQGKQRKSVPGATHFFSLATGEAVLLFFFICSPQMVKSEQ